MEEKIRAEVLWTIELASKMNGLLYEIEKDERVPEDVRQKIRNFIHEQSRRK